MSHPDRVWKIDIHPYDQVLALTQHMINQGIDNLYKRLETGEEGLNLPAPAECYADENNWIKDVIFGPPAVLIEADYSNVRAVKFRMLMKSGSLQVRKFMGIDPKTKKPSTQKLLLPINDWVVVVPIDVSFNKLDLNTPRGIAVQERSAAKGKPNHSIYELLMDLKSMSSSNATWDFGVWTNDDWLVDQNGKKTRPGGWNLDFPRKFVDLDESFQVSMRFYLEQISATLMEVNLDSMGFAVMAEDANHRATFEVNNVRYMTYPWTHPETRKIASPSLSGEGRLNYLLYLETVKDHDQPLESDQSAILSTKMGNWTEGRNPGTDAPGKFGSFVLASKNFMDDFLVSKISCINRAMSVDISKVTTWAEDSFFYYRWSVGASYGIGLGDETKDASEFQLVTTTQLKVADEWQDDAKDFLRPLAQSPGNGATVWAYKDIEWGSTAKHSYAHEGSVEVWMSGDTITFTRVYTLPGSNEIHYEGKTWTKFEYKIDPNIIDPNVYGKLTAKTEWNIAFKLAEVTDGGMKIEITYNKPTTTYPEVSKPLAWMKDDMINRYNTAGSNFEWYIESIRNCLQGQEKFTLPASGVFYFKNPIMDSKANLVCDLEFNGNPKLGPANGAATKGRDREDPGDYTPMPAKKDISVEEKTTKKK